MYETLMFQPIETRDRDQVHLRSLIRFRMTRASRELAEHLRVIGGRQTYGDADPGTDLRYIREHMECWPDPDDEQMLIFEVTFSGPKDDSDEVRYRHDVMMVAHLRGLQHSHGFAASITPESK